MCVDKQNPTENQNRSNIDQHALNRHRFGAHIYLIGDNENSAQLMGVNCGRARILMFALVVGVGIFFVRQNSDG